MTEHASIDVQVRRIALDDTRSVAVGRSDDEPGTTFVEFVNSDGVATRLRLSAEAIEALVTLLSHVHAPRAGWVAA